MPAARRAGSITAAVRVFVDAIEVDDRVPAHDVHAAQAVDLARVLDAGTAALAIAAVHRELRELVGAMTPKGDADDGDHRTALLLARLSAPLGHTAN